MRKLLILAVAALLTVALAAPSFAAETTITGSYRIRGVMDYNWDKDAKGMTPAPPFPVAGGDDLYTGYFDQRFRLTITHTRSEFLKAVVSIDLVEDMWGQQRNFRMNNTGDGTDGFINTAYIQFITKIGLFKLGTDGSSRFGMGTWSDSGLRGNGSNNAGVTWGIKVDNFVATVSYVKYVDFIDTVIDNAAGYPAGFLQVWPGPSFSGVNNLGGSGSDFRDADVDTYVITAHYMSDNYKVGFLYQLIRDPFGIGASYLVPGLRDFGSFAGEVFGYAAVPAFGAHWPAPAGTADVGFGRAGMYDSWLHVAAIYADLKFLDGKLRFKGEYDRIWGTGELTGRGGSYNALLTASAVPAPYRLPGDLKVDGHTVYADLSSDFDIAKVGVAFLYGSGEKHWRPYAQHHFDFHTTGNDDFNWGNVIVPGDSQLLGSNAPLGLGNNPENVTSVKLYWSVNPMEKLDIHGAFIWAKYTQPVGRYAMWNFAPYQPFYGHPMNYTNPNGPVPDYMPAGASDDLGWEIDLGMTYEIMEGLSLNSEFGVLFTGDAFDYMTGNPLAPVHNDWGAIYRWVNTLSYEF
jgi:hypothetical protein